MTTKIAIPIFVSFCPSDNFDPASSVPPAIQRIKAIIVGSCAIWMMRLRRELAVARLVMILAIPDVGMKLLFILRT